MIFEEKKITLKSGESALLRGPTPADGAGMLRYLTATSGETDFMLRYPEECTMTDAQETAFLESMMSSPNDMMILCQIGGEIVGNCCINFNSFLKTKHRASVAIGILKDHWNKGIGTAMFRELIGAARQRGISQLELEVVEGNGRAMALYEKMGFRVAAEKPNAIRLKDGTFLKEYFMVKTL